MSPQETASPTPQLPNEGASGTGEGGSGGGGEIGNSTTVIRFFPNETFDRLNDGSGNDNRVLRSSKLVPTDLKSFDWKLEGAPVLRNFTLLANSDTTKAFGDISKVWEDKNSDLVKAHDDDSISLDLSLFVRTDGFISKDEDLRSFASDTESNRFLTLKIGWQKNDKTEGFSFSPVFVVVESDADVQDKEISETILNNQAWQQDGWEGGTTGEDTGSDNSGSGRPDGGDNGADDASGDNSNGDSTESDDNDSSNSDSASGGGGGGRLSPGAIAGISVGGVVVLIAFAVLLWFFLRRRRSKAKSHGELSQSPNPSNHYIGSKEGNDGDLNSPYSEDGANITQQTPLDPNAPRSLAIDPPAPFAQYRDAAGDRSNLARAGTNTSISTHSHSPVESGSRGLPERSDTAMSSNHRVAHLVEEGMTEEDIRRLEEEERQLDVEIERAGRR
jgi:hypothetical protein